MTTPLTPIPARIEDLKGDVAQVAPADGQALVWVASTEKWTPTALPTIPVTSVFGRTGAVVAASGDYAVGQVTGAADDSAVVHKTGSLAESISGVKTFLGNLFASAKAYIGRSSAGSANAQLEVKSQDATTPMFAGYTSLDALRIRVTPTGALEFFLGSDDGSALAGGWSRVGTNASLGLAFTSLGDIEFNPASFKTIYRCDTLDFFGRTAVVLSATSASATTITLTNTNASGKFTAIDKASGNQGTTDIRQWRDNSGVVLSAIRADGSRKHARLADSAAVNDSEYFSTTAGKVGYKDSAGVFNPYY